MTTFTRQPFREPDTLSIGICCRDRRRARLLLQEVLLMGCWLRPTGFNTTRRMPARISSPPTTAPAVNHSPPKVTAVTSANTGSRAKMSAVRVALVYCCAHVWMAKAIAVANTPVSTSANTTPGDHDTRGGSAGSAKVDNRAVHRI